MTRTINDWVPETKSLLKALIEAGATLSHGDNGEDQFKFDGDLAKFIENLTATDESALYIIVPGREKPLWLSLVYGNEPGVLVSDYTCNDLVDRVTDAHYDKWESRKQPTKTGEYINGKFVESR